MKQTKFHSGQIERTIHFPGDVHQLDQLLMRIGPYSGYWLPAHPGQPKAFEFRNGVRLVWHARQKRITFQGENLRHVENIATEFTRVMKRYGFAGDTKKAAKLLRDLLLALSPPLPPTRPRRSGPRPLRHNPQLTHRSTDSRSDSPEV